VGGERVVVEGVAVDVVGAMEVDRASREDVRPQRAVELIEGRAGREELTIEVAGAALEGEQKRRADAKVVVTSERPEGLCERRRVGAEVTDEDAGSHQQGFIEGVAEDIGGCRRTTG
jgi:hypothetical protein